MKKVFVIVVSYNGMKWINESLTSIYESTVEVEVVVIDNNSKDETVTYIKNNFPQVVLFEQKENLGFGKANNIGLTYALNQNADFVFLLNQDAFVNNDSLENLITAANRNPDYGILSPIQLNYSGKLLEKYFYKFMVEDVTRFFYSDFILSNPIKEIYDIKFVQAAAWFMPRETLMKIGGFDPVFFHYGEDDNYCHRVLFHKLKIGIVSNSFIRHDSNENSPFPEMKFSEKYFKNYILLILVKYCNINIKFNKTQITKERKKIHKIFFISLTKLNFSGCFGAVKQLKLFNSTINKIKLSRKTNEQVHHNYLND